MKRVALLSLFAVSCATSSTPPDEETPPTYEEDEKADNAFESRLVGTKNQWGEIIRPNEEQTFAALATKINELQRILSTNGQVQRGFHAKVHACMKAEFTPEANRPAETRAGVFATDGTKQAWVRFSNGQGKSQGDGERDVRGIAIKLLNVDGPRLVADGASTQDFLMTTRPASHVNDAIEFMTFAEAAAKGELIKWGLFHPVAAGRLLFQTAPVKTLVTKFWTGSPYRVGQSVAKLSVWPCSGQLSTTQGTTSENPDYLRTDIETRLATGDVCFMFGVQLRKEPSNESVEKASSVWSESRNPMIPVGKLVIKKRTATELHADEEYCNDLAFNPWNGIVDHQPLGHMNRARKLVYTSSAQLRGHAPEPSE